MTQTRYDIGELRKPTRLPNGWLRVDGFLTRAGVFTYLNPDGTERRELRPPDEVFKADSLSSFALVPVTDDHPPEALDATNAKKYAVGTVGETVVRDSDHVRAVLQVTDAEVVKRMDAGKTALSCGYTVDLEEKPGTWNGERYDAVQRNIRGNHVALVDVARAGPTARVRMDGAVQKFDPTSPASSGTPGTGQEKPMSLVNVRIDGLDVEMTPVAKQAVEKTIAAAKAREDGLASDLAAAKAEALKQTARADGLAAELAKEKKAREDAESPARVQAAVKARVALESAAAKHLGAAFKADGLDDNALRIAIVEKLDGVKLDAEKAKIPAYVEARFDGAIARTAKATSPAIDDARKVLEGGSAEVRDDAGLDPEEKARRNMLKFYGDAYKRQPKA